MDRTELKDYDGSKPLKNIKHELFVKELFNNNFNQTQAYAVAFDLDLDDEKQYNSARYSSSRLLSTNGSNKDNATNVNILSRIAYLLSEMGLNDGVVEKHLLFAITQVHDISAKVKAIDTYFKYKGKYNETVKVEITDFKAKFD